MLQGTKEKAHEVCAGLVQSLDPQSCLLKAA